MNIWAVLGFIALGAAISELYHWRMWDRYQTGMNDGYWIGNQKELPKKTAVVKPMERKAQK